MVVAAAVAEVSVSDNKAVGTMTMVGGSCKGAEETNIVPICATSVGRDCEGEKVRLACCRDIESRDEW